MFRNFAACLLVTASALTASAQASLIQKKSTSMFESSIDGIIAQFVDGGAWKTTISLVNLDTTVCTYTIKFFGENGSPLAFQTTDGSANTLTGTIPVGGSHVIATLDTNPVELVGWARVTTSNTTGGNAVFRQKVAGRPDFEASMPIMVYVDNNDYVIPVDNFNASNGLALVNSSSFSPMTIFLTFRDEQGNRIYLDSIDLGPMQHTSFDIAVRFPPAAGLHGTVEVATTGLTMSVLPLRFAGGAFTSLLPLSK